MSFLPIGIFLLILYFFFRFQLRRQQKAPLAQLQKEYLERYIVHMQRVEDVLERIATRLEKPE